MKDAAFMVVGIWSKKLLVMKTMVRVYYGKNPDSNGTQKRSPPEETARHKRRKITYQYLC